MKQLTRTLLFVLVLVACATMLYAQKTTRGTNSTTVPDYQKLNPAKNNTQVTVDKKIIEEAKLKGNGMVLVEHGTFNMGSNNGEADEKPVHSVSVTNFYICDHEVTQSEFEAVMGTNPCGGFTGDNFPVNNVSWDVAIEYCNKRSIKEGYEPCYSFNQGNVICDWTANGYRLPTEAEWEYAAGGGSKGFGYAYSGTNLLDTVAWYYDNSQRRVHLVKTKQPNELGLYDMSGNVSEWCWDWYGKYNDRFENSPHGPSSGYDRVARGGSSYSETSKCRITKREHHRSSTINAFLGFRVVRDAK